MSRLSTKFTLVFVSFVGISLFFGGGKVHADNYNWRCPTAPNDVPGNWGMQYGGLEHTFASVVVYAHEDGKSYADGKLNVNYRLNSSVDTSYSYGPRPSGVPPSLWPNARIFKYSSGVDDIQVNGRTAQRWFSTGENLTSPSDHCDGWDEIGPGTSSNIGNGFLLDCQEKDTSGTLRNNHFWVDKISTPTGDAGKYGGYWTIKVSQGGGGLANRNFPMDYNNDIEVDNGENARIDMLWHPNPPPTGGAEGAECQTVSVTTGSNQRAYVNVKDDRGNALVHGPGGDDDWSVVGQSDTKSWDLTEDSRRPKALGINVHIIKKSKVFDSDGNWTGDWSVDSDNNNHYICYDATCDLSMQGNVVGHDNGVESRSQFSISVDIHNRGDPPESIKLYGAINGRPLILSSTSSPVGFWYAPGQIGKGSHDYNTWNVNEPGWNIGNYGVNATLYYDFDPTPGIQGGDLVLANCSQTSYDVYKQFDLKPTSSVTLTPDSENPTNVHYMGRADATWPNYIPAELGQIQVDYNASANRKLYGGADQTLNSQSGRVTTPVVYQWDFDPRPDHAGDKYYLNPFCVAETHGWIGPSNQFSGDTYDECADESHAYIFDWPYLHAYGGDVISDSNFINGGCNGVASPKGISAFRSNISGGSGAQFAAMALGQISGFGTSSIRSGWPHRLSISNDATYTTGSIDTDRPKDGGAYTGDPICAPDFYSTLKSNHKTITGGSVSISSLTNLVDSQNGGKATQFLRNGNLTVYGGDFQRQATIFVNGDVLIRGDLGDLTFASGNYLSIIATGNIKIAENIHRIDGIYVAQGGTIDTCTQVNGSLYTNPDDLYNSGCRSQLVINGAAIAKNVDLKRVLHSLRDSCSGEYVSAFGGCPASNAAEVFNLTPDFYLYTPVYNDVTTGQPYQYITTLPPVL